MLAAPHDPALTEKYWQLLELMRQEFLADIAEYYNCMAPSIQGEMQPAYASKLAKMKSVIQRLSVGYSPLLQKHQDHHGLLHPNGFPSQGFL